MTGISEDRFLSESQTAKYINLSKKKPAKLAVQPARSFLCEVEYENDSIPA